MPEREPTIDEVRQELHEACCDRDELADHGRYYLHQPDIADRHWSLSQRIEELRGRIERMSREDGAGPAERTRVSG